MEGIFWLGTDTTSNFCWYDGMGYIYDMDFNGFLLGLIHLIPFWVGLGWVVLTTGARWDGWERRVSLNHDIGIHDDYMNLFSYYYLLLSFVVYLLLLYIGWLGWFVVSFSFSKGENEGHMRKTWESLKGLTSGSFSTKNNIKPLKLKYTGVTSGELREGLTDVHVKV